MKPRVSPKPLPPSQGGGNGVLPPRPTPDCPALVIRGKSGFL